MRTLVVLCVFALVAGCSCATPPVVSDAGRDAPVADGGSDGGSDAGVDAGADMGSDAGSDGGNDAALDAGPPCPSPITFEADPATEAPATAALSALSPTAMPTWNAARGTFESIQQIGLPLACPDGAEIWDALLPLIDAHPDIFQIDRSEWRAPSSYPCVAVTSSIDFARLDRERLGPGTVAHDFVTFVIARNASGGVDLRGFVGNYLPAIPADVAEEMSRCGGLAIERARDAVQHATFPYATFDRCTPTGNGTYTPGVLDVVALDAPEWTWGENAAQTGVELTSEQPGTLTIDPSYVTPVLESSDLNCPNADDTARVYGYRLTFDVVTGAILSALPGIGCIVC